MTIYYDSVTRKYIAMNQRGDWFPQSDTMLGAIQNALSVTFYWLSVK